MNQAVINWALYEDGREYLGLVNADMPELNFLSQTINGAGIGGNIEAVILGHLDAMTLTLHHRVMTNAAASLAEPRRHILELRAAQQVEDSTSSELQVQAVKHVFVCVPKSYSPGQVAPASTADGASAMAVRRWEAYIDGVQTICIDPTNFECTVDGVDYMAPVKAALGK